MLPYATFQGSSFSLKVCQSVVPIFSSLCSLAQGPAPASFTQALQVPPFATYFSQELNSWNRCDSPKVRWPVAPALNFCYKQPVTVSPQRHSWFQGTAVCSSVFLRGWGWAVRVVARQAVSGWNQGHSVRKWCRCFLMVLSNHNWD